MYLMTKRPLTPAILIRAPGRMVRCVIDPRERVLMSSKKLRFISSAALIVLGLIVVIVLFARHTQIQAAAAEQTAAPAQNSPANTSGSAPAAPELPPGT